MSTTTAALPMVIRRFSNHTYLTTFTRSDPARLQRKERMEQDSTLALAYQILSIPLTFQIYSSVM